MDSNERLCDIVSEVARLATDRVTKKTIRALQRMRDLKLSGDDSELENVWDEICAQIQHEHSFMWATYEDTIHSVVAGFVDELPAHEKDAIWLQTDAADDWTDDGDTPPVLAGDIVDYIVREYVLCAAADYSNKRIRAYIERSMVTD